jgi:CRP/FNR family transcriptional regulator
MTPAPCPTCTRQVADPFIDADSRSPYYEGDHEVCRIYKRGQSLFSEGDTLTGLYRIHSGKVKIYRIDLEGNSQILRLTGPGDIVGYRAILHGSVHTYSAAAIENAEICFVPKEDFFDLLGDRSAFCVRIAQHLADELDATERMVVDMARKNVRERLAEALLLLRNTYGLRNDGTLDVELTREDLAGIVGAATESVIRALTTLKNEGHIDLIGRRIRIVDQDVLHRMANVIH